MLTVASSRYFIRRATNGFMVPDADIDGCFERTLFLAPQMLEIASGHRAIRKDLNSFVRKVVTSSDFILNIERSYKTFWNARDGVTLRAAILPYIAFDLAFSVANGESNAFIKKNALSNTTRQQALEIVDLAANEIPKIVPSTHFFDENLLDKVLEELADKAIDPEKRIDHVSDKFSRHIKQPSAQHINTNYIKGVLKSLKDGTKAQNGTGKASYKVTQKTAEFLTDLVSAEAHSQTKKKLVCLGNSEPSITNLFSTAPLSGERKGQAARALPMSLGNLI